MVLQHLASSILMTCECVNFEQSQRCIFLKKLKLFKFLFTEHGPSCIQYIIWLKPGTGAAFLGIYVWTLIRHVKTRRKRWFFRKTYKVPLPSKHKKSGERGGGIINKYWDLRARILECCTNFCFNLGLEISKLYELPATNFKALSLKNSWKI